MIVDWEYGGVPCLYFLGREIAYFWGIEGYPFGGIEGCLVSRVLEVFSSVEFGIDRPDAGSDHRRAGSEDSHYDCCQRMCRAQKEYPDPNDGNRDSGEWRP